MLCWGGGGADSLSKQTLEARLAVPELSDQFGEICCSPLLQLLRLGCDGVGLGCPQPNEQQLSVLKLDYMFHMAAF